MEKARHSELTQAGTLLPPGVAGQAKGQVLVLFRWTSASQKSISAATSLMHATISWWGQKSPSSVLCLQDSLDTGMVYSVTCGPKAFSRYLKDMQTLKIKYTVQHDKSVTSYEADVNICKLDFSTPVTCRTAISAADSRLLGTAAVSISMSYTPLVSSFEMHEHLASIDHSMPLFPSINRITTPLRQLNLQSHSNLKPVTMASKPHVSPQHKHIDSPSISSKPNVQLCADQSAQIPSLPFAQLVQALERYASYMQLLGLLRMRHFRTHDQADCAGQVIFNLFSAPPK